MLCNNALAHTTYMCKRYLVTCVSMLLIIALNPTHKTNAHYNYVIHAITPYIYTFINYRTILVGAPTYNQQHPIVIIRNDFLLNLDHRTTWLKNIQCVK